MDRLAPARRPDQLCLALQSWRDLLFLHWAVPVREVRRLLPAGLVPDLYRGVAYVSVAALEVLAARPAFVPLNVGLRYRQVTVRTYVHSGGENQGLYVLSLDASSRLVSRLVQTVAHVPCFTSSLAMVRRGRDAEVRLQRPGAPQPELDVHYAVARDLGELVPGSLAFFLLERYIAYFESAGLLFRARVHHRPYRVRNVRIRSLAGELVEAAGVLAPAHLPRHAYHAERADVELFAPELVERLVPVEEPAPAAWEAEPRLEVVGGLCERSRSS